MEETKVNVSGYYSGHSIKANGNVDLKMKFSVGSIGSTVKFLTMLGSPVFIAVCDDAGNETENLGEFTIEKVEFTKDGETKVKFASAVDYAKVSSLSVLPLDETAVNISVIKM